MLGDTHLLFEPRNDPLVAKYGYLFDLDDDGPDVRLGNIEVLYQQYQQEDGGSARLETNTREQSPVTTKIDDSTTTVYATVSNARDKRATAPLVVDGEVAPECEVTLTVCETTTVRSKRLITPSGAVSVGTDTPKTGVTAVVLVVTNGVGELDPLR